MNDEERRLKALEIALQIFESSKNQDGVPKVDYYFCAQAIFDFLSGKILPSPELELYKALHENKS